MANEKRLIDANALKEQMTANFQQALWHGCDDSAYPVVEETIDDAPTVDAVEVVRCKDCKHWQDIGKGCTDHVRCCEIGFYMIGENGYCYFGERSADNENL